MKSIAKIGLIIAICCTSFNYAKAQNMRFGVFADPQLSWFNSDTRNFKGDGVIFGFNAGFSFDRYFAERYAITTGASITNIGGHLLYANDGYTLDTRDETYDIDAGTSLRIRGQYVNVPLGFKFRTTQIGYTTIFAQLGINSFLRLKGFVWEDEMNIDREVLDKGQLPFGFVSYMIGGGI